ncbi:hypothetical protein FKP32DRAFT_493938 [Trametes sanguinea]|nr:hypothetical protein FKP32DRAFT_493938 [Trametes sanguinea]
MIGRAGKGRRRGETRDGRVENAATDSGRDEISIEQPRHGQSACLRALSAVGGLRLRAALRCESEVCGRGRGRLHVVWGSAEGAGGGGGRERTTGSPLLPLSPAHSTAPTPDSLPF